jgi:hypothetical protein
MGHRPLHLQAWCSDIRHLTFVVKGREGTAPVVILDLAGRSLSVGFVNLDVALLSPGTVAHLLETNSNGY